MRQFFTQPYKNLNKILVQPAALLHNHRVLTQAHPQAKICPVLKSNAYGHGLPLVAPIFDSLNSPFLAVDSLFEAYQLTKLKVKTPILIMGYTHPDNLRRGWPFFKKPAFSYMLFERQLAVALNQHQPESAVHIFVDTGMNREGVGLPELREFVRDLKKLKHLTIEGIASHFADADNPETQQFSLKQITAFKTAVQIIESEGIHPKWQHISASAGAYTFADPSFNLIRAGIASYGISPLAPADPASEALALKPALSFHSTLVQVKTIPKGSSVGYSCSYTSTKKMTIGVVAAGYYEGVDRRLSNKGVVQVGGTYAPIIGKVSMNMTVVDVSQVPNPQVGDEVVIYSTQPQDKNSIGLAAQTAGTIPYELLVHLNELVKRTTASSSEDKSNF